MARNGSVTRLLSLLLMVPLAVMLVAGVREALDSVRGLRIANGVVVMAEVDRGLLRALIALRALGVRCRPRYRWRRILGRRSRRPARRWRPKCARPKRHSPGLDCQKPPGSCPNSPPP